MKGFIMLDIKDLRRELKLLGYKLRMKKYSEFIAGDIVKNDITVNRGCFTLAHLKEHSECLNIIKKYKGKIEHDGYRVVL